VRIPSAGITTDKKNPKALSTNTTTELVERSVMSVSYGVSVCLNALTAAAKTAGGSILNIDQCIIRGRSNPACVRHFWSPNLIQNKS